MCEHIGENRLLIPEIKLPLKDGHHTSCVILQCQQCGDMSGFPESNLKLAESEGTDEVIKNLSELREKVKAIPIG